MCTRGKPPKTDFQPIHNGKEKARTRGREQQRLLNARNQRARTHQGERTALHTTKTRTKQEGRRPVRHGVHAADKLQVLGLPGQEAANDKLMKNMDGYPGTPQRQKMRRIKSPKCPLRNHGARSRAGKPTSEIDLDVSLLDDENGHRRRRVCARAAKRGETYSTAAVARTHRVPQR